MSAFLTVSIAILLACICGFVARAGRLPPFIGYVAAGVAMSVLGIFSGDGHPLLASMAQLGVTFLLFLVGLEMNTKEIFAVSPTVFVVGMVQIAASVAGGFLLAQALGFSGVASVYIGLAVAFSSTVLAVKFLSEKQDLASLYGRISIGILLLQDVLAVLALIILAGFGGQTPQLGSFVVVLAKGILLLAGVYLVAKLVLNRIFDAVAAASSELLYLASIAWALVIASIVSLPQIGFSAEIGGFLAGVALAGSSENLQISSRIRPLRDFFVTVFFLLLGAQLTIGFTWTVILPVAVLSLFVLVGKPLIVMAALGFLGYKNRTSFLVSTTLGQVSEFSLILVAVGARLAHVESAVVSLITVLAVVTMTTSGYVITNVSRVHRKLRSLLVIFERKRTREGALSVVGQKIAGHTILIGVNRTGRTLLPTLKKHTNAGSLIVVDFNPKVIQQLTAEGGVGGAIYGDITDFEILDLIGLVNARLVISTVTSLDDNLVLLEKMRGAEGVRPVSIFVASYPLDALKLYEAGADYVIVPQVVGGEHLAHILATHKAKREYLEKLRTRHFDRLARDRFAV